MRFYVHCSDCLVALTLASIIDIRILQYKVLEYSWEVALWCGGVVTTTPHHPGCFVWWATATVTATKVKKNDLQTAVFFSRKILVYVGTQPLAILLRRSCSILKLFSRVASMIFCMEKSFGLGSGHHCIWQLLSSRRLNYWSPTKRIKIGFGQIFTWRREMK